MLPDDFDRKMLETEYFTWALICLDKHGLPWPVPAEMVPKLTDIELNRTVKNLKELARTPHT